MCRELNWKNQYYPKKNTTVNAMVQFSIITLFPLKTVVAHYCCSDSYKYTIMPL